MDRHHQDQRAADREQPGEKLRKAKQQAVGKSIHIRNDAADRLSGRVLVQIGQRQAFNLLHRRLTNIPHRTVSDMVVAGIHDPLRCSRCCHQDPHLQ